MNDKIKCKHCGSSLVIKCEGYVGVRPIPMELVNDWSKEADDTMGKETLLFIYVREIIHLFSFIVAVTVHWVLEIPRYRYIRGRISGSST